MMEEVEGGHLQNLVVVVEAHCQEEREQQQHHTLVEHNTAHIELVGRRPIL